MHACWSLLLISSCYFQINYETLKNSAWSHPSSSHVKHGSIAERKPAPSSSSSSSPFIRPKQPDTVQRNLKAVQGWRGAAERGFLAVYPDLIHAISKEGSGGNASLTRWYTKVKNSAYRILSFPTQRLLKSRKLRLRKFRHFLPRLLNFRQLIFFSFSIKIGLSED